MIRLVCSLLALFAGATATRAADVPVIGDVEGQPLAANVSRVLKALDFLGAPLPEDAAKALAKAVEDKDAKKIQELLDKHVLFAVTINPEARLKVAKGPGSATIQQAGWTPVLVKAMNDKSRGSLEPGARLNVEFFLLELDGLGYISWRVVPI